LRIADAVTHQPDLILMDMSLPGIDGWTAAAERFGHPAACRMES